MIPYRWVAIIIFVLSSALNYLDRVLMGNLAIQITNRFELTASEFANQAIAFSLVYTLSTPFLGLMIDRLGLTRAATICVVGWSIACAATGTAKTWPALIAYRMLLAFFESGGIALSAKAFSLYLQPKERAFGGAISQTGLTLGAIGASYIAATIGESQGWGTAFFAAGALGLVWVPLWLITSRLIQPTNNTETRTSPQAILHSRTIWKLVAINILVMLSYGLWLNVWTTMFFVRTYSMTALTANTNYAWIPGLAAVLGGLFGAWWVRHLVQQGHDIIRARYRICMWAIPCIAATALAPHMPNATMATLMISLSISATLCLSVNLYALPLDLFPTSQAGFAVSLLTVGYGLLGIFWSKAIGIAVDHSGFTIPCTIAGLTPFLALFLLNPLQRAERT